MHPKENKAKKAKCKRGALHRGVCYNAFERKRTNLSPVLGLYLLYTIRRKNKLCKDGAGNNGGQLPPEDDDSATGYSVQLGDKVNDAVKAKTYIRFVDNASDQAALEEALGNLGLVNGAASVLPETLVPVFKASDAGVSEESVLAIWDGAAVGRVIDDFANAVESQNLWLEVGGITNNSFNATQHGREDQFAPSTCAALFVIGSSVKIDKALNQVADAVEDQLAALVNSDDADGNSAVTYDYDVSVSVVEKPVTAIDWFNASANFIAVTVTRTVTQE